MNFDEELTRRISKTLTSSQNIELEVVFNTKNSLKTIFDLIKRFKTLQYDLVEDGKEILDIFVLTKGNSLRVSLSKNDIFEFCKTNKIPAKAIKEMILKKPLDELKKIQNKEYDFNVNIKNEIKYNKLSEALQVENEIYKEQFTNTEFNLVNKRFRFKKDIHLFKK